MNILADFGSGSMGDEHSADVQYRLNGGPLEGAIVCIAVDLLREQTQVRITAGGTEHIYLGDTIADTINHITDGSELGHAWRPVRWIEIDGKTYIFSDDRPTLPVGVAR